MENHIDSTHDIERIESTVITPPNIKLSGDIPHGVILHVRLGNEKRIMDSDAKEAEFAVAAPGNYWIEIEEDATKQEETIANPRLFFLVKLFQGIVDAFSTSADWVKHIKAYVVKGRIEVEIIDRLDLLLIYQSSEYREEQEDWSYPSLQVTPALISETEKSVNSLDFDEKLNQYIRGFTTTCVAAIIIFGTFAVVGAFSGSIEAAVTCGGLVAGTAILAIGNVRSQSKKCRRLYANILAKKLEP